ncbi:MAG: hypothetical protein JOZ36_12585 [Acidobacteria bacterium]|nr:hypothetical protein [Acidobacteriota bacterium]
MVSNIRMSSRWSTRLFLLFLCLPGLLSTPGVFGQATPSSTGETVKGTVINSVTHEPVGRALVYSSDSRFATMTDSEGRFEFSTSSAACGNVSAVACLNSLAAKKPGFVDGPAPRWGAVQPGKDVTLAVTPEALIIGHISLPSSEPPDRIDIELYRREVREGRAHWEQAGMASTRSDGEFRFAELTAGSYKLLTRELLDRDPLNFNPRAQLLGYPPVYFPHARDFVSSQVIQLSAGHLFHAEMSLVKHPYYPVKIPLTNAPPGAAIDVRVSLQGRKEPGFSLGYNQAEQLIEGLLPNGTYTIEASSYGQSGSTGSLTISVRGGPVQGSRMVLTPNRSIAVKVKEEFTAYDEANTQGMVSHAHLGGHGPGGYLHVYLEPADDFSAAGAGSLRAPASAIDEELLIDNVPPGRYWVRVNTSRGYTASITSGGVDLLREPLVVASAGSSNPIEIVMRDDWAEIICTIEDLTPGDSRERENLAAVSAQSSPHIYLIPQSDSPGDFRDLGILPRGEMSIQVPPGLYRVIALDAPQEELEYYNAEAMRAYEAKEQVIHLVPGQKEHLRLHLSAAGE